ncbi:MAG: glycerol-3-phosphate dehydrogenase/oxidase [Deltaproteobacteria bacterium]|nr:glycerol-3-phosphate dehydrogenase/oxidase [Deltaproteobacteria bacterium]
MKRAEMLQRLSREGELWDVIVVGGGATGLGVAVDAANRGYKTLLLEQSDFAQGTSSRSTKLIHGGVRYLKQGNISLVLEALHERGLLLRNAPHLVRHQSFIVPAYDWWDGPFYGIGLKLYDMLAGELGFGASQHLSRRETIKRIPTVASEGLLGGIVYFDGQFDDARLAINLAQTAVAQGATLINHTKVIGLKKGKDGLICGVRARDEVAADEFDVLGKVVINASGVFVEGIIKMDIPSAGKIIAPSQGAHIVVDKKFLPGKNAIMVPHTDDGRVMFAVPWEGKVVVGTTDTPIKKIDLEPRPLSQEVDFIIRNARQYLAMKPNKEDILSTFAGIRPLFIGAGKGKKTAQLSRDHTLLISPTGLVTITGGKWTTYRKMAEDTVNQAAIIAGLARAQCQTENLPISGAMPVVTADDPLGYYGSDACKIRELMKKDKKLSQGLSPQFPYSVAEIVWAVREEMAIKLEDVLSRRTRALLLDAKESVAIAPRVATVMAQELGKDESWVAREVAEYTKLAQNYLPWC